MANYIERTATDEAQDLEEERAALDVDLDGFDDGYAAEYDRGWRDCFRLCFLLMLILSAIAAFAATLLR